MCIRDSLGEARQFLTAAKNVGGLKVLTAIRNGMDANALRQMGDFLRDKAPDVVAVLASANGEKITFLAVCGPEAVKRGIKAGDLVKQVCCCCGGSGGGLDVLGLIMSKRDSAFTVGKFALGFNALLYTAILILFDPEVAIYSVIYNFANSMILDRMHQQNVTVQALIFTREDESVLADFIIKQLGRSVTYWDGVGAYTKDDVRVLCVCLSKYEIEELLHMVHSVDPHAFLTVQEGVRVFGNFPRKLG